MWTGCGLCAGLHWSRLESQCVLVSVCCLLWLWPERRGAGKMWSLLHSGDKGCFHALMFHEENDRQMKIE